jgi:excinuclease UvrABC ATPase subunit
MASKKPEHLEKIIVKGARTHNLKNITVEMPRHKMIVELNSYRLTDLQ